MKSKFKNQGSIRLALYLIALLVLAAVLVPAMTQIDPYAIDISKRLLSPSWEHWMGTDDLGRDVFTRMAYGARISLGVGLAAAGLSSLIGIILGATSAYFGKWVDMVIMRLVDVLMCIPGLYLVIMFIVLLGPGVWNVVIVIALTGWTGMARLVRGEVLALRNREFILSAKAAGAGHGRILFKHLLPNALTPVYVAVTFDFAGAIMMESGLSFLGLGVQAPYASWGNILESGREFITQAWWLITFPGLAILATMLLVNYLGESLRQHFKVGAGS